GRSGPLPLQEHPLNRAARGESYSNYLLWVGGDEDRRAVTATARTFSDPDNDRAGGSVIVLTDVTDLVNALKARDDFISTLAHELQTPLTSILGHLDLVLEDENEISPQAREYLHVGGSSAERLLTLVSEILDTASGSPAVRPRPADVAAIIGTRVTSISAPAQKAGITLVQDVPDSLPASVDPLRIGQVLDNLISNAIKYSPDGGTVTVRASKTDGCIQLEVEDQGIGISESEVSQIFSKFFRSSSMGTTKIPGTGLGLSIAKMIVENHHGTISCTSEPGAGTKFTVKLPNGLPLAHPGQDR
ncbi:sensor histidine kinase, partial [Arthrobacter sp. H14]|uniref:sensor histidine kinase n=1 Tax=Arthrobacter sp. H14 TaxID=1312959 RepID=UPI00138AF654